MTPNEFEEVSRALPSRRSDPSMLANRAPSDDLKKVHRRTASSLSKRRSVSGMTGLMPFALSTPASCPTTPMNGDGDSERKLEMKADGCVSETLTRDSYFPSNLSMPRAMTTGSPAPSSISEDKRRSGSVKRASLPTSYHSTSLRVQTLGPIEERNSSTNFQSPQKIRFEESASSDLESLPGTDGSGGVPAPCPRTRQQSFETPATSLASTFHHSSPKFTPSLYNRRQLSWIEIDSDGDDEGESSTDPEYRINSKRFPKPPCSIKHDSDQVSDALPKRKPFTSEKKLHRSASVSGDVSFSKQRTGHPAELGHRRRSSTRTRRSEQDLRVFDAAPLALRAQPRTVQHDAPREAPRPKSVIIDDAERSRSLKRQSANALPSPVTTDSPSSSEDESVVSEKVRPAPPPKDDMFDKLSPPPSPVLKTPLWILGKAPLYDTRAYGEDAPKGIPLPPEVMETLRVSISCFPETMLLSGSLTIETIRAYSKKLRHSTGDLLGNLNADAHFSSRRTLWNKVRGHGRPSISSEHRHRYTGSVGQIELTPKSSGSLENPKPWMPLKHIFGCCSDYICDALYAHIVAYNYVSTLVPKTKAYPGEGNRLLRISADKGKSEEIPRKAASLLGLSSPSPTNPRTTTNRLARKLSLNLSALKFSRDVMGVSSSAASTQQDAAARDILAGLMQCIARLVTTSKAMAESGSEEERVAERVSQNVDILFVRSLCEIVRISEEAILSF